MQRAFLAVEMCYFCSMGAHRRSSGRSNLTSFGKWVGEQGVHRTSVCDVSAARDEETVLACRVPGGRAAFASPPSLFVCKQSYHSVLGEVVLKTIN